MLTTGARVTEYFGSEHRQSPYLRRSHPDPLVQIHPEAATARGIAEADWVYVESPRGRARLKAKLFDGIDPRVVCAEFGWWYPERSAPDYGFMDSNINMLTDDTNVGPESGATNLRGLMCEVRKAA